LQKAVESKNTCTAVYSSGLQVSGTFLEFRPANTQQPSFIKTKGPTILCYDNELLKGHGKDHHRDGFSSPVGKLRNTPAALEDIPVDDLPLIGIEQGKQAVLNFESGIIVKGVVKNILANHGKILL